MRTVPAVASHCEMGAAESTPSKAHHESRGGQVPQSVRAGSTSVQDRIAHAKRMEQEAEAHNHVLRGGKAKGKAGSGGSSDLMATAGLSKKEAKRVQKSIKKERAISKKLAKAESKRAKKESKRGKKVQSTARPPSGGETAGNVSISGPVMETPPTVQTPERQTAVLKAQADARRRAEEKAQQWQANEEQRRRTSQSTLPEASNGGQGVSSVLDRVRQGEELQNKAHEEQAILNGAKTPAGESISPCGNGLLVGR